MAAYAVFEPPGRSGEAAQPERIVFVRDGFSWGAFLLGPVWILWHRLWLVLLGYAALVVALEVVFRLAGVATEGRMLVAFLLALLLGFEGASLRRWTLARRGWRERGIVVADDREAAERRFFELWVAGRPPPVPRPAPVPSARPAPAQPSEIIGLFPEPGGRR